MNTSNVISKLSKNISLRNTSIDNIVLENIEHMVLYNLEDVKIVVINVRIIMTILETELNIREDVVEDFVEMILLYNALLVFILYSFCLILT